MTRLHLYKAFPAADSFLLLQFISTLLQASIRKYKATKSILHTLLLSINSNMQLSHGLIITTLLSAGALALPKEPVQARTHMNQTPWIATYDAANIDCSGDPLGPHVNLDKGTDPKAFARTDITTNVKVYFGDSKCIVAYTSYTDPKVC